MWQSYWDDPWVLAEWPLLRRRRLTGSEVLVHETEDGIAVRVPADGYESVLLAGEQAVEVLNDDVATSADRILVMGDVAPAVRQRLAEMDFDQRRTWDWYSTMEDRDPTGANIELLDDPGEVQALLLSAYPLADRRTSTNGRWWGVHRDGLLVAAGAADTWRGHGPDGAVDWNSHLRSFTVHHDFRGEGIGTAVFSQMLYEEWRRTGWVQWSAWGEAEDTRGLMKNLGVGPTTTVTNFRPSKQASATVGYPGAETA